MKANVGTTDKSMRLSIGLLLIFLTFLISMSPVLKVLFIIVGAVALLTAFFGFCLTYRLFGIDTCKIESRG